MTRWYTPAYTAYNGRICAIGHETVVYEHARRETAAMTSEDDQTPVFVAFRDVPEWIPVTSIAEVTRRQHTAVDGSMHAGPAHPCAACDAMDAALAEQENPGRSCREC